MYLGIDTSTSWTGVALAENKDLIAEMSWHTEQNHSVELLPGLNNLFKQMKRDISAVEGICVALGPGSFNGLRVGLSAAKGLAYALEIPLVGVSSLEAEAYPFSYSSYNICAIHGAGRGELAAGVYRRLRSKWTRIMEERIITPEELCSQIIKPTLFCGEIPENIEIFLKARLGSMAHVPHPMTRTRRPGNVLYLGLERLLKGEKDDPAILQPIYLRRPPITPPKKGNFGAFKALDT